MAGLYDIEVTAADGTKKRMNTYEGDALLIVNVASKCGLTPQYEGLEALNRKYGERGLRVIGFPCNDFAGQEPGTMEEIQSFCKLTYDVSFELLQKIHVLGDEKHPLYAYLTEHAEPQGDITWNFEKFVIGKGGAIVARLSPKVTPDDPALIEAIESAL
ncbi:glutathione peroxidase [Paenibacillus cymbidii]|uniref:glutathione peroxidase n=1 Tax=Paenibacillus cymbidii TaxID=1639034 RepID=UPI0010818157|nr:glutathione peroxidase [Paenibacillus cymbidii]